MHACCSRTQLLLAPALRASRAIHAVASIVAASGLSRGWGGAAQLWRSNVLRTAGDDSSAAVHHAALLATVQSAFAEFAETSRRKQRAAAASRTPSELNNTFFEWQRLRAFQHAIPGLAHSSEFAWLEEHIAAAAVAMLRALAVPERIATAIELGVLGIDAWAAVHTRGAAHGAHVHEQVGVSGVFYLATPRDAGALRLHDPRGTYYSGLVGESDGFGAGSGATAMALGAEAESDIVIHPAAGDLILFPPWLIHSVLPTSGEDERVTISFNVHGEWGTTLVRAEDDQA